MGQDRGLPEGSSGRTASILARSLRPSSSTLPPTQQQRQPNATNSSPPPPPPQPPRGRRDPNPARGPSPQEELRVQGRQPQPRRQQQREDWRVVSPSHPQPQPRPLERWRPSRGGREQEGQVGRLTTPGTTSNALWTGQAPRGEPAKPRARQADGQQPTDCGKMAPGSQVLYTTLFRFH